MSDFLRDRRRLAEIRALDAWCRCTTNPAAQTAIAGEITRLVVALVQDDTEPNPELSASDDGRAVTSTEVGSPASEIRGAEQEGISGASGSAGANVSAGVTAGETAPLRVYVIPPDADWREARRLLREQGHEVKQFEGLLYVDGVRCDDPALLPPGTVAGSRDGRPNTDEIKGAA